MQICLDMRTGAGCGTKNPNHAHLCSKCGKALRFAVVLHDPNTHVGRYRVGRVMGYGAYGAVYEAIEVDERQTSSLIMLSRYLFGNTEHAPPDDSARRVVLKETFDASHISSFERELRVLSGLHHANLPRYLHIFEAQGNGYLVMEYVPGPSLQEILDAGPNLLSESQVLGYALQLCDVLAYLHSQQPPILHRDIKPANIRLTPEGRIKLVDFGLYKMGSYQIRATIRGLGTPAYAPIEQYGDYQQARDVRSDIYSLGATLYHLFSGQEPLSAPNRLAGNDDLLPPLQLTLSYVSFAVMKAMSLMPRDRFANISQFRQALVGWYKSIQETSEHQPLDVLRQIPLAPASGRELEAHELFRAKQKSVREIRVSQPPQKDEAPIRMPAVPAPVSKPLSKPKEPASKLIKQPVVSKANSESLTISKSEGQKESSSALFDEKAARLQSSVMRAARTTNEYLEPYLTIEISDRWTYITTDKAKQVIIVVTAQGRIYQWRIVDGHLLAAQTLPDRGSLTAVAISGDKQKIATASRGVVRVWELEKMTLLFEFHEHPGNIQHLAFRPDDEVLAGTVRGKLWFWQMGDGQLLRPMQHFSRPFHNLIYSPDGKWLACKTSRNIHLLNAANGELIRQIEPKVSTMAWHPDSNMLASYSNHKRIKKKIYLRREDGHLVSKFEIEPRFLDNMTWIPTSDSSLIAAAKSEKIHFWTPTDPPFYFFRKIEQDSMTYLDYALNGQVLVGAPKSGKICLWHMSELLSPSESQETHIVEPAIIESQVQWLRNREQIAKEWNGLKWGATLSDFKAKFPHASQNNEWGVTGLGEEAFCGILMDAQYAFNDDGKFYLVTFYAKPNNREEVKIAARNEFGAANGGLISWTIGDIEIEVKLGGLIVTMTYQKLAPLPVVPSSDQIIPNLAQNEAQEVVIEPAQNETQEVVIEPAQDEVQEVVIEPAQDEAQEVVIEPAQNEAQEVVIEPAQNEAQEVVIEPAQDEAQKVVIESAQNEAQKALNGEVLVGAGNDDGMIPLSRLPESSSPSESQEIQVVEPAIIEIEAEIEEIKSESQVQWERNREQIAKEWNGLKWGATLFDFKAKFPHASQNDEWGVTGLGEESFCGILMDVQYAFNDDGKFYLVTFYAKPDNREEVKIAARNEFGAPNGQFISWIIGHIEIEVKLGGLIVMMTHKKFADMRTGADCGTEEA